MPTKVLGQAGVSLSDVYDVEGSVAGVEELDADSVKTVHEMGSAIFSERLNLTVERIVATNIPASANFISVRGALPSTPWRVLGVTVFSDVATRVSNVIVTLHSTPLHRDMPIWVWDAALDAEFTIRFRDNSSTANDVNHFRPASVSQVPTMGCGKDQRENVSELALQGTATAFGAGTVTIVALVHLGFSERAGISSYGLPIPSW